MPRPATRLAPSPTGALHLGNARTFLVTWALARARGWDILLRIEDLDGPRVKQHSIDLTIDLLAWLGLDWDAGPVLQSADLAPYALAMRSLAARALAYPSDLSRAQIELAASAPQEDAAEPCFPSSLRPPLAPREFDDPASNWRFACPDVPVLFTDAFAGPTRLHPARSVGDFILWTKRHAPAYQLAVVVDDARQGITHVVRGNDLLDSAARQILLYHALNLPNIPTYTHLPLVRGTDGKRLAKRHGDTRLDSYRARGATPQRVIGLLAHWCNIVPTPTPMDAPEFRQRLALDTISPADITFRPEDDSWLLAAR